MSPGVVGFLIMNFVGMTLINQVMAGQLIQTSDMAIMESVMLITPVDLFGVFSISVPNLEFFISGLPALMQWDYSFFGGNAGIIVYLMYSITGMVSFGLLLAFIGMTFQYFRR